MRITVDKQGSCMASIRVELDADVVARAFARALREVGKKASLPGFRPGHVPSKLIERQFAPQVSQAAAEAAVQDSMAQALSEAKIDPVAQPRLQLESYIDRGQPFIYRLEVEYQPEVAAENIEGLRVAQVSDALPERAVEDELERLRQSAADTQPVEGRSVVQKGDFVLLDYRGTIDGEPLNGAADDNALVEVGASGWIPGFTEGLIGAQVPGAHQVEAKFPNDYSAAEVRGKTAQFAMTLKELKEKRLPELNDAFAQDLGDADLSATRARLQEQLAQSAKKEADNKRRRQALEALVAANTVEVPPSRVDEQIEFMVDNFQRQMRRMMGANFQLSDSDRADLRSEQRAEAEFLVRAGLLLGAAADKLSIEVTPEDIAQEIERMAQDAPERADALRAAYKQPDAHRSLAFRMTEDKVVERILATATAA